ncbi:MAG: hypothetical protein ABJF01_15255 [bacterium]
MTHPVRIKRSGRAAGITRLAAALLIVVAACSHNNQPDTDFDPRPDPIPIRVTNENFLDMNVAVVAGGASRRLGPVNGNSTAQFKINWSVVNGQSIYLTATPIGGQGLARSAALNVSPGQMIDFKVGSVLRQSVAIVHDP